MADPEEGRLKQPPPPVLPGETFGPVVVPPQPVTSGDVPLLVEVRAAESATPSSGPTAYKLDLEGGKSELKGSDLGVVATGLAPVW